MRVARHPPHESELQPLSLPMKMCSALIRVFSKLELVVKALD
jgi:hypothetical protein